MFGALAVIVVVLSGLKIAFSGNIQPWELVRVVIGIWIPWVMLQFYTNNIPGMAFTFPGMIAAGGNWLHDLLVDDSVSSVQVELTTLFRSLAQAQDAAVESGDLMSVFTIGFQASMTAVAGFTIVIFMALMMLVLSAVTYAQVIWAQIALAILIILGPIFIPFPRVRSAVVPVLGLVPGDDYLFALRRDCRSSVARVLRRGNRFHHEHGNRQPGYQQLHGTGYVDARGRAFLYRRNAGKPQVRGTRLDARHRRRSRRERSHGYGEHSGNGGSQRRHGGGGEGGRGRDQMKKPQIKDAGAEYAEIWGETIHTNRHLRVISGGLAIGVLLLILVVFRIVSVEPPRPIVVRVDEVGRAEAVAYEAMGGPGGPAGPHHQIFPQPLYL